MQYKGIVEKRILVKVTSRERKDRLLHCVKESLRLAHSPQELMWLFTFDEDDNQMPQSILELSELIPNAAFRIGLSNSKIHAINRDMDKIPAHWNWNILLNLSDDQVCRNQDWDKHIKDLMPNDLDASLFFFDGRQFKLNTMEIVGRTYYNRFGYIYYPEYKSFFADNEAHDTARKLGKQIKSSVQLFSHENPMFDKRMAHIEKDELYTKQMQYWDHDQKLYNSRR